MVSGGKSFRLHPGAAPGLVDTIAASPPDTVSVPDLLILENHRNHGVMNKPEQSVAILTRINEMGLRPLLTTLAPVIIPAFSI